MSKPLSRVHELTFHGVTVRARSASARDALAWQRQVALEAVDALPGASEELQLSYLLSNGETYELCLDLASRCVIQIGDVAVTPDNAREAIEEHLTILDVRNLATSLAKARLFIHDDTTVTPEGKSEQRTSSSAG